jgi:5'-3' exonuclease
MKLEIVDVNNWLRRVHEKDTSGLPLRNLYATARDNVNPMIYVFDGKGGKKRRQEIYPNYKANREPAPDAFYTTLELFKLLVSYTHRASICIPGWEADDVIAKIVRSRKPTDPPIEIWSNDADFLALLGEGVTMTDPSKKFKEVKYEDVRLYKTLVGDTSDNIPGIHKFGPKSFVKMAEAGCQAKWVETLERGTLDGVTAEDLMLSKAQWEWVQAFWNSELLKAWQIIGFIDVPDDVLKKHTTVGQPCRPAAEAILKTVFQ